MPLQDSSFAAHVTESARLRNLVRTVASTQKLELKCAIPLKRLFTYLSPHTLQNLY